MKVTCPHCNKLVSVDNGRYGQHGNGAPGHPNPCFMSEQYLPAVGCTPGDHVYRASVVADLAWQVQDADPAAVWGYLTALDAAEVQRLLMLALAAVPVDGTIDEIWAWVNNLPAAKYGAAA